MAVLLILLFEVMDKEPSLGLRALLYIGFGLSGILLSRKHWWWGLFLLPIVAVFAWIDINELNDESVRTAILQERGRSYFVMWYAAIMTGILLPVIGAILEKRQKLPARSEV